MSKNKFFPYSGFLSGVFSVESMDAHEQGVLNTKLEYATLTGDLRQTNSLLAQGAKADEDLLMATVTKKWSRFSQMFLNYGVKPTAQMTDFSVRNNDTDTLDLLLEHRCPVSSETKIWAGVYGSSEIKETLNDLESAKAKNPRAILPS